MQYKCSVCGKVIYGGVTTFVEHAEHHIIDIIKQKNPAWVEKGGICPKCLDHYKKQLKGE